MRKNKEPLSSNYKTEAKQIDSIIFILEYDHRYDDKKLKASYIKLPDFLKVQIEINGIFNYKNRIIILNGPDCIHKVIKSNSDNFIILGHGEKVNISDKYHKYYIDMTSTNSKLFNTMWTDIYSAKSPDELYDTISKISVQWQFLNEKSQLRTNKHRIINILTATRLNNQHILLTLEEGNHKEVMICINEILDDISNDKLKLSFCFSEIVEKSGVFLQENIYQRHARLLGYEENLKEILNQEEKILMELKEKVRDREASANLEEFNSRIKNIMSGKDGFIACIEEFLDSIGK